MKSQETLADFTRFCEMHPDLRFWQALRNWAGVRFIFVAGGIASKPASNSARIS